MMENSDEAIERVWKGLREVEAPAGMERRILQAVRDGVPEGNTWSLTARWRMAGMRTRAIAVVGVLLVSSIACWTAYREYQSGSTGTGPEVRAIRVTPSAPKVQAPAVMAQQPLPERGVARSRRAASRRARLVRADKSTTFHEMQAANHPAPEAPLTEQERLLLRLAHRSEPSEIAVLNPSLWAARDAEEKTEVQKFFEPSTTGDNR